MLLYGAILSDAADAEEHLPSGVMHASQSVFVLAAIVLWCYLDLKLFISKNFAVRFRKGLRPPRPPGIF